MRLRKPCSHNLYDAHEMSPVDRSLFKGWTDGWCPGGEFLPEDAIEQAFAIIESLTDPRYVIYSEWQQGGSAIHEQDSEALADQVGEPG